MSSSSKKSTKKNKKAKYLVGEIKNVTITYPGIFDYKGWNEFITFNR